MLTTPVNVTLPIPLAVAVTVVCPLVPNVNVVLACPLALVVVLTGTPKPPPVTANDTVVPGAGLLLPSRTSTTSGFGQRRSRGASLIVAAHFDDARNEIRAEHDVAEIVAVVVRVRRERERIAEHAVRAVGDRTHVCVHNCICKPVLGVREIGGNVDRHHVGRISQDAQRRRQCLLLPAGRCFPVKVTEAS